MTKEEIIKLAKEKEFVSKELYNNPYKHSTHEDMRWLFWLTEIQKWLTDKHNILITVFYGGFYEKWTFSLYDILNSELLLDNNTKYISREQALEFAIVEALKLI